MGDFKLLAGFLLLMTFSIHRGVAQEIDRIELIRKLESESNDSIRFNYLRDLGYSYEDTDTSSAMGYYRKCYALAVKLNSCDMKAKCYTDFGNMYLASSQYQKAEGSYRQSFIEASLCHDKQRMAKAFGNMGITFDNRNMMDSAVFYTLASANLFEYIHDSIRVATCYNHISYYYSRLHMYNEAIDFGKRALALSKRVDEITGVTTAYINIARAYQNKGEGTMSVIYCDSSAATIRHLPNAYSRAASYQNLATMLHVEGRDTDAERYADSCIYYSDKMNNPKVAVASYTIKGSCFLKRGNWSEARKYLDKALSVGHQKEDWRQMEEVYRCKAELEQNTGDYRAAYEYYGMYNAYRDSTFDQDVTERVTEMNARFQSEKKEKELELLSKEKNIEALKAGQQRRLKIFFIGLAALATGMAFLLFVNYRRRNIINIQKEILQQQRISELEKEKQMVSMNAIIRGEENERSRMAKDLHDGLGSLLSGVKLSLSSMKENVIINEEYARIFSSALSQLDNAINEMRNVAHNMMPEPLHKFGLLRAVQNMCEVLSEAGKVQVHFEHPNFDRRLSSDHEVMVYRIIQELVNNSIKHAQAKEIIVQLSMFENEVQLVVEDEGRGFDSDRLGNSTGSGYANLQHRVNYLKGTMDIRSAEGTGTSVMIQFPV